MGLLSGFIKPLEMCIFQLYFAKQRERNVPPRRKRSSRAIAGLRAVLGGLLWLGIANPADAASLFFVPSTPIQNVVNGDSLSFDIHMDFTDSPTLGGGFSILYDPNALMLVSFDQNETIGDPEFSRPPDLWPGVLDTWAVGALDGLPATAVLGSVVFEVLTSMGTDTLIYMMPDGSICGCWVGADFVSIIRPDYGSVTISRVPVPAAIWFMLGGLGALLSVRPDRPAS